MSSRAARRRLHLAEMLEGRLLLSQGAVPPTASAIVAASTARAAVTATAPIGAPQTPVYTSLYDLTAVTRTFPNGAGPEHPWTIGFDRTTQTAWLALRGNQTSTGAENVGNGDGGNRIIQLDPATDIARVYNLQGFTPSSDPHGVTFDFETHITPRVWYTRRPSGVLGGVMTDPNSLGKGGISYIDPVAGKLVNYDFVDALRKTPGFENAIGNFHGIAVDPRGNVWATDPDDSLVVELDLHTYKGVTNPSINSTAGTMIVHRIPPDILGFMPTGKSSSDATLIGPHGVDTVIDETTGQVYVYITNLGTGRVMLLRPSLQPGGRDRWTTWEYPALLENERNQTNASAAGGVPLFVGIDNNETPGDPLDDKIYFADPGGQSPGYAVGLKNVIREINLAPALTAPPNPTVRIYQKPTTVQTYYIQPPKDQPTNLLPSQIIAQPTQVFVDREGHVYYIDRRYGAGRFNPAPAGGSSQFGAAPTTSPATIQFDNSSTPTSIPINPPVDSFPVTPPIEIPVTVLGGAAKTEDNSMTPGLSQYDTTSLSAAVPGQPPSHGASASFSGALRGALNAGDVLFGSLTPKDQFSMTVFAEAPRRQMSVVSTPGGSMKAFQVLRDGSLVMTYHGEGELLDHQVNLTAMLKAPGFDGDVSAVIDSAGVTHVYGRSFGGGLLEYRNPVGTQTWVVMPVRTSPGGPLGSDPTTFNDPVAGTGVLFTTAGDTTQIGHLILFPAAGGPAVDLTAKAGGAGAAAVYSSVGAVVQGGVLYVYGTNQTGGLIEYRVPPGGGPVTFRQIRLPDGRDTLLFQDVTAINVGPNREVFGTDGTTRLIQVVIGTGGDSAVNVTEAAKGRAVGYSPYQLPFAGRVYSDLAAVVDPSGNLYVYGTNARDLVEFVLPADGSGWRVTDLTNALPANRVFGAPDAYITPSGDRHILQIDEDGEVVEYSKLNGLAFSTQNITLSLGNSSSPPKFPTSLVATPPAPLVTNGPSTVSAPSSLRRRLSFPTKPVKASTHTPAAHPAKVEAPRPLKK